MGKKGKKARLSVTSKHAPQSKAQVGKHQHHNGTKSQPIKTPNPNNNNPKPHSHSFQACSSKPQVPNSQASPRDPSRSFSIPFHPPSRLLLLGEGDFSFSSSLLSPPHSFSGHLLTCTTFESSPAVLYQKYPQAKSNIATLEAASARVLYGIDATALGHPTKGGAKGLLTGSDGASKGYDFAIFMFPHTGGLTKDVNRQVRANQELVVGFLGSCIGITPDLHGKVNGSIKGNGKGVLVKSGKIVVTLFEGQPYELWGIRNLARHVGLSVVRSCRFEWGLYRGYRHARTLGNVEGANGGKWKGEEREARMYVFARKGEEERGAPARGRGNKRKRGDGESSDEEDGGDDGVDGALWEQSDEEYDDEDEFNDAENDEQDDFDTSAAEPDEQAQPEDDSDESDHATNDAEWNGFDGDTTPDTNRKSGDKG